MDLLDRNQVGLQTESPTDPASGTNWRWDIPLDTRIEVISITFLLTAAGAGGDRMVTVEAYHGSTSFAQAPAPGIHPDSAAYRYYFAPCILGIDKGTDFGRLWAPISPHFYLDNGQAIGTNISNLQATDQLSEIRLRYYQKLPR